MSICCHEHAAKGDPFGCYRKPYDEIAKAQWAHEAEWRKRLDEWVARRVFERDGMIPKEAQ